MSTASIKVSVRCRPFSKSDTLGVMMQQLNDDEGEVELINCDYQTTRFPFSYSWWSAYGYEKYVKPDGKHDPSTMKLIDQQMAYNSVGLKIKEDLLILTKTLSIFFLIKMLCFFVNLNKSITINLLNIASFLNNFP